MKIVELQQKNSSCDLPVTRSNQINRMLLHEKFHNSTKNNNGEMILTEFSSFLHNCHLMCAAQFINTVRGRISPSADNDKKSEFIVSHCRLTSSAHYISRYSHTVQHSRLTPSVQF